jgi:hypothetical protein
MRKELTETEKDLVLRDLERRFANEGTADLETKGLTREEEDIQLKNVFYDIRRLGDYEHIHTIRVVPLDCDREPYFIVDTE